MLECKLPLRHDVPGCFGRQTLESGRRRFVLMELASKRTFCFSETVDFLVMIDNN